ncbi:MAG: phage tail protein [Lachnospiraceae bacterium]|nr:phage tail protein [Lachnospiraceae bacterium]
MAGIQYTIRKNRYRRSYIEGFKVTEDDVLVFDQDSLYHGIFLDPLDGIERDRYWGRLAMKLTMDEDMACYVYVLAINDLVIVDDNDQIFDIEAFLKDPENSMIQKVNMIQRLGAKRFVNRDDILLYDLSGKNLLIGIEILGQGDARIENLRINAVGDNFMNTFPEVYRERNSFFHRYMSIFSSIYNDFQDEIDNVHELLDLDTCSTELLELYGSWMGIDLQGGYLSEDILRTLVKEGYNLNKMKGTRKVIERIMEIVLGEKVLVLEHNSIRSYLKNDDSEIPPGIKEGGIYDVSVLVKQHINEELQHRLVYLLNQFKPLRTRINIIEMDKNAQVDSNSYLDLNATIPEEKNVVLDEESVLGSVLTLE